MEDALRTRIKNLPPLVALERRRRRRNLLLGNVCNAEDINNTKPKGHICFSSKKKSVLESTRFLFLSGKQEGRNRE